MHPVLRQMKPTSSAALQPVSFEPEGEGIARVNLSSPEHHPRVQLKKEASESFVPPCNILRDHEGEEGEEKRDLCFRAGQEIKLNPDTVLSETDFEKNPKNGISNAQAQIKAAELVTAYEQTVKEEVNFQKTFNNNVRTLIARDEVMFGLMHLWDFINAYVGNPSSKALTAQLFLIVHHCRDDGILKESLLTIGEPESKWLYDLISMLQTIVVQERGMSISEKVAAINYTVMSLSNHYAKKIYNSIFVPLDKEAKISTFYMRIVVQILVLSDDLGVYRNERVERAVSSTRKREMSDRELMFNLKQALAGEEWLDEDEQEDNAY
ncbi:p52K [bottlenose dolphin adenovirus 2]|uniref:P52K n=1 Tax=bottlenose dolphin adenovirus 2 TaxID=2849592 RepID=A0A0M4LST8_9ADEN|nr:p52K [Bottlenose dolphin adenovirus 1]ALE15297.1 p52K [Bottlenose dolphin adenovirus 1]